MPARDARATRLLLCVAALVGAAIASVLIGAKPIAIGSVIDALFGRGIDADAVIVREGRLPRTLLGLLAGTALALSGALAQALTRNPLADPGLLGVNAGASFAMVLGVALFGASQPGPLLAFAFCGAAAAAALVYWLGATAGATEPARFVLAGIALSAVLMGFSSALTLFDTPAFDAIRHWSAGTLAVRDGALTRCVAAPIALGIALCALLARPLDALVLGDTLARALGANPRRLQSVVIVAIALLCGATTAAAGPIAFVGLMIPQFARRLGGAELRWVFAFSAVLGPVLLLAADIVGRVIVAGELRVAVVTAFVGAPVLIAFARRERSDA